MPSSACQNTFTDGDAEPPLARRANFRSRAHPKSRGRLLLRDADPARPPTIDTTMLSDPADARRRANASSYAERWAMAKRSSPCRMRCRCHDKLPPNISEAGLALNVRAASDRVD